METINASIWHCQACGHIEHSATNAAAPQCCGTSMTKACPELLPASVSVAATLPGDADMPPPEKQPGQKPR